MAGKDEIRQTNRVRGVPRYGSGPANRHLPGVADRPARGQADQRRTGDAVRVPDLRSPHAHACRPSQVDRNVNMGIKLFLGQLP